VRYLCLLSLICCVCLFSNTKAYADVTPEGQLTTFLDFEKQFSSAGVRAAVVSYYYPNNNDSVFMFYFGPTFTPVDNDWITWWIAPQFGFIWDWFDPVPESYFGDEIRVSGGDYGDETVGTIFSLWTEVGLVDNRFTFSGEVDIYFQLANGDSDYYGMYTLGYHPFKFLDLGWQWEQVNNLVLGGPHVFVTWRSIVIGTELYYDYNDCRMINRLVFGFSEIF